MDTLIVDNQSIAKRLKIFLETKNISIRQIEEEIGAGNGTISSAIRGDKEIGSNKLAKIISIYPELNTNWLLNGIGEMLTSETLVTLSSPTGKVAKNGNFGQVALSIMGNAFAGDLIHPEKDIAEYMAQQAVGLYANTTTIGFYVCGESMMPVLIPTDVVLCQRVFDIKNYDFKDREAMYVIVCDEGIKVKRLQPNKEKTHYKIISINHVAYPEYEKEASDIYEVWRVEWIVKKA